MATFLFPFVLLLIGIVGCALGDLGVGHCAHISPVHVDEKILGGVWYEVKRVKSEKSSGEERCNFESYSFSNTRHGWALRINSTGYVDSQYKSNVVDARQFTMSRHSSLAQFVLGGGRPGSSEPEHPNLFVVHLEDSFSVLYFCQAFGSLKAELAWIMSRQRTPNRQDVERMEVMLFNYGIRLDLVDVDQENCDHPEERNNPLLMRRRTLKSWDIEWDGSWCIFDDEENEYVCH